MITGIMITGMILASQWPHCHGTQPGLPVTVGWQSPRGPGPAARPPAGADDHDLQGFSTCDGYHDAALRLWVAGGMVTVWFPRTGPAAVTARSGRARSVSTVRDAVKFDFCTGGIFA
jgi:hypothetical protein